LRVIALNLSLPPGDCRPEQNTYGICTCSPSPGPPKITFARGFCETHRRETVVRRGKALPVNHGALMKMPGYLLVRSPSRCKVCIHCMAGKGLENESRWTKVCSTHLGQLNTERHAQKGRWCRRIEMKFIHACNAGRVGGQ